MMYGITSLWERINGVVTSNMQWKALVMILLGTLLSDSNISENQIHFAMTRNFHDTNDISRWIYPVTLHMSNGIFLGSRKRNKHEELVRNVPPGLIAIDQLWVILDQQDHPIKKEYHVTWMAYDWHLSSDEKEIRAWDEKIMLTMKEWCCQIFYAWFSSFLFNMCIVSFELSRYQTVQRKCN